MVSNHTVIENVAKLTHILTPLYGTKASVNAKNEPRKSVMRLNDRLARAAMAYASPAKLSTLICDSCERLAVGRGLGVLC